ncbi:MAG: hypothetical protein IJL09_01330, partial [Lachnospiraceae bacterium]|nr:hypothetical protein [Lachnospiraceae bacterium]
VTSGAFMAAVRECLKQTGITMSVLEARKIEYPAKSDTPVEMKAFSVVEIGQSKFIFIPLCGEHFEWNNGGEMGE